VLIGERNMLKLVVEKCNSRAGYSIKFKNILTANKHLDEMIEVFQKDEKMFSQQLPAKKFELTRLMVQTKQSEEFLVVLRRD